MSAHRTQSLTGGEYQPKNSEPQDDQRPGALFMQGMHDFQGKSQGQDPRLTTTHPNGGQPK